MASQNVINMPTHDDIEQAKLTSRTLSKYHTEDRVKLSIESDNNSDTFVLPGIVMQMLLNILSEFSQGNSVVVIPHNAQLSTQQVADMLNVSRPHLGKLLENGDIDFTKVGSHRRVLVSDVLDYKARIDKARIETLEELTELSQELDLEY